MTDHTRTMIDTADASDTITAGPTPADTNAAALAALEQSGRELPIAVHLTPTVLRWLILQARDHYRAQLASFDHADRQLHAHPAPRVHGILETVRDEALTAAQLAYDRAFDLAAALLNVDAVSNTAQGLLVDLQTEPISCSNCLQAVEACSCGSDAELIDDRDALAATVDSPAGRREGDDR